MAADPAPCARQACPRVAQAITFVNHHVALLGSTVPAYDAFPILEDGTPVRVALEDALIAALRLIEFEYA